MIDSENADPRTTVLRRIMTPRKVFVPYINGHVYDLWGGERNNIRMFPSREDAERYHFTDVREIELWEDDDGR